jgi:hypothetical protein
MKASMHQRIPGNRNWVVCSVATLFAVGLAGCSPPEEAGVAATPPAEAGKVATSGKEDVSLDAVPAEVIAAAKAMRPDLQISAAEHEVRNGADYYDIAGQAAGAEVELDITRVADQWTVVEVQRDLNAAEVPSEVSAALAKAKPSFTTTRIIESDQGDGVVIYEFFGADADRKDTKVEVRFEGGRADALTSEWVH